MLLGGLLERLLGLMDRFPGGMLREVYWCGFREGAACAVIAFLALHLAAALLSPRRKRD
jgi:hypothetical protein